MIACVISTSQTLVLLRHVPAWRHDGTLVRGLMLFAASAAIYAYEIAIGFALIREYANPAWLTALLGVLMGAPSRSAWRTRGSYWVRPAAAFSPRPSGGSATACLDQAVRDEKTERSAAAHSIGRGSPAS